MTKQNILIRMLALFLIVINFGSSFAVSAQEPEPFNSNLKNADENTGIIFDEDGEFDDPSEESGDNLEFDEAAGLALPFSFKTFFRGDDKIGQKVAGYTPLDSGQSLLNPPIVPKDTPILKLNGE